MRYSKYEKIDMIGLYLIIFGLILFIGLWIFENIKTFEQSNIADGFTIESYKVILDVKEDNTIDVEERIIVDFYEYGHHGIIKYIPERLDYTSKDGKIISRRMKIYDINSSSDEYTAEWKAGDRKIIKMGNSNVVLPKGPHEYIINYTYDFGKDPFENSDEFIFHAFGDFWKTRINNASIEINLPKKVNIDNNIKFFADKYRRKDITSKVDYSVSGSKLKIKVLPEYSLKRALTVDIELPEGYFSKNSWSDFSYVDAPKDNYDYEKISSLICWGCVAFSVIALVLYMQNSTKKDEYEKTEEIYPPNKFDASEIGYLYKNDVGLKLVSALILGLAGKGLIQIEEREEDKKCIIKKNTSFDTKIKKSHLSQNERLVYERLFEDSDELVLDESKSFGKVYLEIENNLRTEFDDAINDLDSIKRSLTIRIVFFASVVARGIARFLLKGVSTGVIIYDLSFYAIVATLIFSIITVNKKSHFGNQMKLRINSFKKHILLVSEEEIEKLESENSNYFYDILPYAYVFEISKKWKEKFQNSPNKVNDTGNFNYFENSNAECLETLIYGPSTFFNNIYIGYTKGCSSCGGGTSSCGGGSSSCGGGSSSCGGGRSW